MDLKKILLTYVDASEDFESSLAAKKGYMIDIIETEYGKIMVFKKKY